MLKLFVTILCIGLSGLLAHAASPLSKVGTANVVAGHRAIENRIGYTRDSSDAGNNQRLRSLQLLDYSLNDTQAIRFITEQDKPHGGRIKHRGFNVEYWHQFFERRINGWDGAIRLTYAHRDNNKRPNIAGIRFMGQGALMGGWSWRQNIIFTRSVGAQQRSGFGFESRSALLRSMRATPDHWLQSWQLGAEMFNDVGRFNALHGYSEQDHQFGPIANFGFANGVSIQTGYRAGISSAAPNHSYKLFTRFAF